MENNKIVEYYAGIVVSRTCTCEETANCDYIYREYDQYAYNNHLFKRIDNDKYFDINDQTILTSNLIGNYICREIDEEFEDTTTPYAVGHLQLLYKGYECDNLIEKLITKINLINGYDNISIREKPKRFSFSRLKSH